MQRLHIAFGVVPQYVNLDINEKKLNRAIAGGGNGKSSLQYGGAKKESMKTGQKRRPEARFEHAASPNLSCIPKRRIIPLDHPGGRYKKV